MDRITAEMNRHPNQSSTSGSSFPNLESGDPTPLPLDLSPTPLPQKERLYVYFPMPLAAAIGLEAGEEIEWELLDRGELHLVRKQPAAPSTRRRARPGKS